MECQICGACLMYNQGDGFYHCVDCGQAYYDDLYSMEDGLIGVELKPIRGTNKGESDE